MYSVTTDFDVIVVGAGPAGSSTAIALAQHGLRVALLDKAAFPRDKVCGDALSLDVMNQLNRLSPELAEAFGQIAAKKPSYGLSLFAPNYTHVDVPFYHQGEKIPGYLCKRYDFDNLLFRFAGGYSTVHTFEETPVKHIERSAGKVVVQTPSEKLTGAMVVGADGAHSIVNKHLGGLKTDKRHTSAGLRIYYEGVSGFRTDNNVELHFFREALPGYLWLFPLPDNRANVGIGMLSSHVARKKVNLKQTLSRLIATKSHLSARFREARALEKPKGFGMPLGGKRRKITGDRFLLTGDAAGFIDPFSGEGIGNAIRSGRFAAAHIAEAHQSGDYSARFNQQYAQTYYHKMWREFRISRSMQYLSQFPGLFNFVANHASRDGQLQRFLSAALENPELMKRLTRPGFYAGLLFSRNP